VVKEELAAYGLTLTDWLFKDVTVWTATLHGIVGLFIPLLGATFMVRWSGGRLSDVKDAAPSLLLAGVSFVVPYYILARFTGPYFPSLLGAAVGLVIYSLILKAGILTPSRVWDFSESGKVAVEEEWPSIRNFKVSEAIVPYALVVAGLLVTRLIPGVTAFTKSLAISIPAILGTTLAHKFTPLYNPGTIFVIAVLINNVIFKLGREHATYTFSTTIKRVIPAAIALIFAVALSQVMMNSGHNESGMGSMLQVMAESVAVVTGKYYIFLAVFVGILGAYMAGSNTVSNILFGGFQYEIGGMINVPKTIIAALQNVGGAVGNMICVFNVVAVCTTVGILGEEGLVIRRNLLPTAIYGILAGILAALAVFVFRVGFII